ncbi:MAG: hypothetical protein IKR79_01365, partial [Bacteroidales bacterium]|nr:hypothetical protein [Bacteroidales bacterium]
MSYIFYNKKLFLTLALMLSALVATAQNGINSPYSQYGIGLSNMPYNIPTSAALGGVAYTRSS